MEWPVFSLVAIAVVGVGILTMNRTGINFRAPNCPQCGTKLPTFRKPASVKQAMWGGWTCASCGCETDKWGRRRA